MLLEVYNSTLLPVGVEGVQGPSLLLVNFHFGLRDVNLIAQELGSCSSNIAQNVANV